MNAHLGTKIDLPTKHGMFQVTHVTAYDGSHLVREGVVLERQYDQEGIISVRIQSSCLFSESFWASDCDCALQLQGAMEIVSQRGGLLLYFYEEGRGAGLETKFKAIQLQQSRRLSTKQAFECLNISPDPRSYKAAAAVLVKLLEDKKVNLLTNNPAKSKGLKDFGVNIVSVESLVRGEEKQEVKNYLRDKAQLLGHEIPPFQQ